MNWTLAAALWLSAGTNATAAPDLLVRPVVQEGTGPTWQLGMRLTAPVTSSDPGHLGIAIGIGRVGTYRASVQYQPAGSSPLGLLHGSAGVRIHQTASWTFAADGEYGYYWPAQALYRTGGFQFERHDRRALALGVLSAVSTQKLFKVVTAFEVGGGKIFIREQVVGRVGGERINDLPVPILKSASPVGMFGVRGSSALPFGLTADARVRVIVAGHSRGGAVPFAYSTVDWEITRPLFKSSRYGRGHVGLTGTHATSPRAATYYQNGLGLTMKIVF